MSDAYIVLAIFAVMFAAFGLAMWSLFRPQKKDEFEELRLAFKALEDSVAKELEPIFRRLSKELGEIMNRSKR